MPLDAGKIKLSSDCVYDKKIRIIESGLMKKLDFHALVSFYSEKKNQFAAGEFFGKIIRAACVIYAYTKNEELFEKIKAKGIEVVDVTLHIGLGTFRPVKVEDTKDHVMHSEEYEITKEACDALNKAKKEGRRIIAIGTTSIRTLEANMQEFGTFTPIKKETNIFKDMYSV